MAKERSRSHDSGERQNTPGRDNEDFPGYPHYPSNQDIYRQEKEETELDPEDVTRLKAPNPAPGKLNEKDFRDEFTGEDLDIPGSELDDELENIGSEDEENNYYSLGGDNHDTDESE